ncbi:MAG: hypothetical protein II567_09070 [Candidatus Riflebacteria bacterium]|jgi:hypothetical protein|nr:hypothetical protein [Candidatus Riflebacteria bacterium]
MSTNDTVFNDEDLLKLESVIKNVKDANARKRLVHLQHGLKKKIKERKEAADCRKRSLTTAYMVIIPFTILFAIVGVYYFLKKEELLKNNNK